MPHGLKIWEGEGGGDYAPSPPCLPASDMPEKLFDKFLNMSILKIMLSYFAHLLHFNLLRMLKLKIFLFSIESVIKWEYQRYLWTFWCFSRLCAVHGWDIRVQSRILTTVIQTLPIEAIWIYHQHGKFAELEGERANGSIASSEIWAFIWPLSLAICYPHF